MVKTVVYDKEIGMVEWLHVNINTHACMMMSHNATRTYLRVDVYGGKGLALGLS